MTATASLLRSLDAISHETTLMVGVLDDVEGLPANERREARRKVLQMRAIAHELFDWLSAARLEEPRN